MALDYRYVDPKTPSNTANPTGTQPIIDAANRDLVARYRKIQSYVNALIKTSNLDIEQAQKLINLVAAGIDYHLLDIKSEDEEQAFLVWWFADYTQKANDLGLAATVVALSLLLRKDYKRSFEIAKFSDAGLKRVELGKIADFANFKELSEQAKADLTEIITNAIKNGTAIDEVKKEVADRLNVSLGKAKNYVQTAIPDAQRQAVIAEMEATESATSKKTGLLWYSALKATTRAWHASRHGKAYSIADVKAFYSRDGNKYNCYCNQVPCLVDDEGKLIASDDFKAMMRSQRKQFSNS
jgi:SPP1 gp7 family putative phage head morphogenesis protein